MKKRKRPSPPPDPWASAHGNLRPTPERRAKGAFRLAPIGRNEANVAIDDRCSKLRDCYYWKKITRGQLYAGERFEGLARASAKRGPRSCLDWSPRGYGETESEYQVRLQRDFTDICKVLLGMETSFILLDVTMFDAPTGPRRPDARRWVRLVDGLEALRKYWGLPHDED